MAVQERPFSVGLNVVSPALHLVSREITTWLLATPEKSVRMMKWLSGFRKETERAEQGDIEAATELLDLFANIADDPHGIHPDLIGSLAFSS
jgi:hypothetical protein